jgi:hypothetical protein
MATPMLDKFARLKEFFRRLTVDFPGLPLLDEYFCSDPAILSVSPTHLPVPQVIAHNHKHGPGSVAEVLEILPSHDPVMLMHKNEDKDCQ